MFKLNINIRPTRLHCILSPLPHCSLLVQCEFSCPRVVQIPLIYKALGAIALHGRRQHTD